MDNPVDLDGGPTALQRGKAAPSPRLVADDLAYWRPALRLVAAMVLRQHFLPDIVEDGGKFCAMARGAVAC